MPRPRRHEPLRVLLNNRLVGHLNKAASGAIDFRYDQSWLDWEHALPVSLALPLREDPYRGEPVVAVFDNLLPDSDALRRRVAEKVGAAGVDAYSLLAAIGHDCVGALQFVADDDVSGDTATITGEAVADDAIERLLNTLAQAPLGLDREDPFRISVAGAQEKTALLRNDGRWLKPHAARRGQPLSRRSSRRTLTSNRKPPSPSASTRPTAGYYAWNATSASPSRPRRCSSASG